MKIYLHIGMSKAGSSAIQLMLFENRPVLASRGICYPLSGIEGVHAHFGIYHELVRGTGTDCLRRALEECRAGAVGVISCESFWLLSTDQIERLAGELHGIETEVVLYLRAPHRYLPSSYRQSIRHRGNSQSFADFSRKARGRLDFPRLLQTWARHFRLRVRVYDLEHRQLCRNFCELTGLPAAAMVFPAEPVNPTPCDGALRVMRGVNAVLPETVANRIRRRILAAERWFDFLPRMNDSLATTVTGEVVGAWDLAGLRAFLSEAEIDSLCGGRIPS